MDVCTHTDVYNMHVCIYTLKSYNKWVEGCLPVSVCLPVQAPAKSWTRVTQVTVFNDLVTIGMGHWSLFSKSRKQILIQEEKDLRIFLKGFFFISKQLKTYRGTLSYHWESLEVKLTKKRWFCTMLWFLSSCAFNWGSSITYSVH